MLSDSYLYRVSSYLIDVRLDRGDQYVLVHGYTGAIDIVDQSLALWLLSHKKRYFKKSDLACSKKISDDLERRGYITQKTEEEEYRYVERMAMALHRKEHIMQASFTIVVTYNCNFRCPYCFEENLSKSSDCNVKFSKQLVDKLFESILLIEPRDSLRNKVVKLYGGEPLLKENYEIVKYIVSKGMDIGFVFGAVTNGYDLEIYKDLISPEMIKYIQITIDGEKEFHNKRRIHYLGYPTFDKIISNIGIALDRGAEIVIRVNTDKNNIQSIGNLKKIFNELHYTNTGRLKIDSALLRKYKNGGELDFFSQKDFIQAYERLHYSDVCQNYGIFSYPTIIY